MADTPENPPKKPWSSADYRSRKAMREENKSEADKARSSDQSEKKSGGWDEFPDSPEIRKFAEEEARKQQMLSNVFQQAINSRLPKRSASKNKAAERRLELFTDPKTGKTQMVLRTDDEPAPKPSHGQTTGQKIRKLCEAVFGVVAVIFGTQITSSVVSLGVLIFGWGLLTALIWELKLFNAKTKPSRAVISAVLTVILGGVLYVAYRVSRPAPSAPPLTRTELHEELQGLRAPPQTTSTPSVAPSPAPAIKRSAKKASRTVKQRRREQKALRDLHSK